MNKIRIAIVLIVLFVLGVVLTVQGAADIIKLNGYVPDFNYDSMADIEKGGFVQGYVENILDSYASETTTESTLGIETSSRISEEYFIMPLINEADAEKELFVTISAGNTDDRKRLYRVAKDTWEYMSGHTDFDFTEMYIVARVKKMDSDLMPFLTEWFTENEWYGSASEAERHVVPYEFVVYRNLNAPYISLVIGLIIIAAFVAVGVIFYKKTRPARVSYADASYSAPPANVPEASENGFAENVRPSSPVPDIPQPVQPDEFFARPERKTSPAEKKAEEPKPEPKPREEVTAVVTGDMDGLDTSALNMDELDYYDAAEESDGYAEYEFSNDGDFADADADSIELSE
ncbi:MAG: hypothetical protein NC395_04565 [Prevotella sp.]|nr:hypothetical protein [Prevotella sp.]